MTPPASTSPAIGYAEVIGDPIAHSQSPLIHGFWLEALGIDAEYRATHVRPDALGAYFAERRADPAWRGCNVTIPHKAAALDHADRWLDPAAATGAANCIVPGRAGLIATNTDIAGFLEPLADADLAGMNAAVIGAGGAARAIALALARRGVARLTIFNRDSDKAARLLAGLGIAGEAAGLEAMEPAADILVNASALGMVGHPPLPVSLAALSRDAIVYDIVYAPLETDLLKAARDRGLWTIDGLEMLVGQAAAAFEMFFRAKPPRGEDIQLRGLLRK